ncbi:MAG: fatty acid desaturase [Saprospiraceae bacterium]
MSDAITPGPETESLPEYTDGVRKGVSITWYRSPLPPGAMKMLQTRSDIKGAIQTLGCLGLLICTAALALYSFGHWPWWITLIAVFLHGTVGSFGIDAVHELGHGTVFKTKWLNVFFCRVFAFLGMINHEMFQASHTRHHRYTLHPPDDLEVVLPMRFMLKQFLRAGFVNKDYCWCSFHETWRVAHGRFMGPWEATLYPEGQPELRAAQIQWARFLLVGHATVLVVSLIMGWWLLPILVSLSNFYGGALFFFCNNTQHIGLQDKIGDFRLCCRTFTVNPLVRFLYWQMNYHIEHHMYAAVPCYNLKKLHKLIETDLPPTPHGLIATWKEIYDIQLRQEMDPSYQHQAPVPHR